MPFYDTITWKRLDRNILSNYCDDIVSNMENQSAAYVLVSDSVKALCNDDTIKGKAIEGFQTQMNNYVTAMGALCYANELDRSEVANIKAQLSGLSMDIYNGDEIVDAIHDAEDAYDSAVGSAAYWRGEANNTPAWNIIYKGYCNHKASNCDDDADDALAEKTKWEGKARELINIDCNLTGLFSEGKAMRDTAKKGLEQIQTSFNADTGAFVITDNAWVDEVKQIALAGVVDDDGNVNWEAVEQILSKDGDSISDFEYEMLAYAYLNIDVSEMERFYMLCGEETDPNWSDYTYFSFDNAKIAGIKEQTTAIEQSLLLMEMYGGDYSEEELSRLHEMQNQAMQRLSVLGLFENVHTVHRNGDESYFTFTETTFGFHENGGISITIGDSIVGYGRTVDAVFHTYNISEPMSDSYLLHFGADYVDAQLNGITTSGGETIVGDGIDFVISQGIDSIGEDFLGNAAKGIPYIGFVVGVVSDLNDNYQQQQSVNSATNLYESLIVADDFDCTGVIVEGPDGYDLDIYAGTETGDRIDNYENNTGQNVDDLFTNPVNTFETVLQHMQDNPDINDYHNLFTTPDYSWNYNGK